MAQWITYLQAARIAGCNPTTILNAVRAGEITSRHPARHLPSLDRETVEQFAQNLWERREQRAAQAAQRRRPNSGPPDITHLWLTPDEAGDVIGVSGKRIRQLTLADQLPHTRLGRRVWIRLDHAEQAAAVRAFWG